MEDINCSKCNKSFSKDFQHCPHCGIKAHQEAKFCQNCGSSISLDANVCGQCGAVGGIVRDNIPGPHSSYKNENIAAVLSFLIVGLGQIYNGEVGKGILLFIAGSISAVLISILIGIPMFLIIWIYGIYDAHSEAKRINQNMMGMY